MYSAEFFPEEEEDAQPSKFEQWLEKKLGSEKLEKAVVSFSVFLGVLFSVGLFFLLPTLLSGIFDRWIHNAVVRSLIEGVIRIAIFMGYMILISRMKDMKRVFSYHGAEHKTIRCYEAKLPLTVENARQMTAAASALRHELFVRGHHRLDPRQQHRLPLYQLAESLGAHRREAAAADPGHRRYL